MRRSTSVYIGNKTKKEQRTELVWQFQSTPSQEEGEDGAQDDKTD